VSARGRSIVLWAGLLLLAAALGSGLAGLPPAGRGKSAYGDLLARLAAPERSSADAVAAVNFDFRGFDTLGEELILFTAVAGVGLLLRHGPRRAGSSERDDRSTGRAPPPTSSAVRVLGAGLAGGCVCLGLDMATHGQVSPGGGFQGGVVLATVPLTVYLSMEAAAFRRVAPRLLVELGEGAGIGLYAAVGLLGLLAGKDYLANVLPLGVPGDVLSAGTVLPLNLAVALAVSGGLLLLIALFLAEALEERLEERR
jgi:multicomponent Na+:H+ antiporter subunit B